MKEIKGDDLCKVIIILSGDKIGKNIFDKVIKENGLWVWNINPYNPVGVSARYLGAKYLGNNFKDSEKFNSFVDNLIELSDEYWDYKYRYCKDMITNFKNDENTNVLVVHGCDKETSSRLIEENPAMTFSILIKECWNKEKNISLEHDKTLFIDRYNDSEFQKDVIKTINILTKKL